MRAHLHALHNVARPVLVAQVPVVSVRRRKQQLLGAGRQRLARRPTRLVERLPIPSAIVCGTRQYTIIGFDEGATFPEENASASSITTAKTICNTSIERRLLILFGYL